MQQKKLEYKKAISVSNSMAKSSRIAGQNIRNLALKRRTQAIISFFLAGLTIFAPIFMVQALNVFLRELSNPLTATQSQQFSIRFPSLFYLLFIIIALLPVANGFYLLKRAKHADQGAKGEEDIAQSLEPLAQENWKIEYNLPLQGGLGDADIICISPKRKIYVIDVKSHRGEVFIDKQQLKRRIGTSIYSFEKDFLNRAMKQAFQVKKQRNYSFVTPIVAFSDAKVSVPPEKLRGVYVVERVGLTALLKSLE